LNVDTQTTRKKSKGGRFWRADVEFEAAESKVRTSSKSEALADGGSGEYKDSFQENLKKLIEAKTRRREERRREAEETSPHWWTSWGAETKSGAMEEEEAGRCCQVGRSGCGGSGKIRRGTVREFE